MALFLYNRHGLRDINAHFAVFYRFLCVITWRNVTGKMRLLSHINIFPPMSFFFKHASEFYYFPSMNALLVPLGESLVPWRSSFCGSVRLTLTIVYQQCAEWMGGGEAVVVQPVCLPASTISVVFPSFQVSFKISCCSSYILLLLWNMATDCEAWLNANPVGKCAAVIAI